MSDISRNNIRTYLADLSNNSINNSIYAIVNEMLNSIEDDETHDTQEFNPFLYRRRGNYTIGRNVDASSPLFNMITRIFDTSGNTQPNETNEEDEPIIEEITFQVTYPLSLNIPPPPNINTNDMNSQQNVSNNYDNRDNRSRITTNLNVLGNTINSMVTSSIESAFNNSFTNSNNLNLLSSNFNRQFGSTIRSYYSTTPYNNYTDNHSQGGLFEQILTQSLYDEKVYKKKISEKGKTQLTHIHFDKNNSENMNTSCPINQTDFENNQYVIQLPCNHMFTPEAINRWLDEKPECPVCRFELDSIEVRREPNDADRFINRSHNSQSTMIPPQSPLVRPSNNLRYNDNSSHTRLTGRDRIQLNDNSYLDYLYEEIDNNDFQRALILSYRELIDVSGDNVDDNTDTIYENSNRDDTDETNTVEIFEAVATYVSDNMPDSFFSQDSEITEPSELSMSDDDINSDNE